MTTTDLRILVTNDDGVESPGLWHLAEAMATIGEVLLVAPKRDSSGAASSISVGRPLEPQSMLSPIANVRAFVLDGTPADCVVTGLRRLSEGRRISIIASGINRGANVGNALVLSGTIGAAMQGHFRGLLSLAFNLDVLGSPDGDRWDTAARAARFVAQAVADGAVPPGMFLNVNVPGIPWEAIQGVRFTRAARSGYARLVEARDESGRVFHRTERRPDAAEEPPDTDIWALVHGYISITPLQADITHHAHLPILNESLALLTDVLKRQS